MLKICHESKYEPMHNNAKKIIVSVVVRHLIVGQGGFIVIGIVGPTFVQPRFVQG